MEITEKRVLRLDERLRYSVRLAVQGFSYPTSPYGGLAFRSFTNDNSEMQFRSFADTVCGSVGHRHLPIYRMADGEFAFMVGWRPPILMSNQLSLPRRLRRVLAGLKRRASGSNSPTVWGETYRGEELDRARLRLEQSIQHVAEHGILALYLMERPDRWGEQYARPVSEWFVNRGIQITSQNYAPFYFVYALLNGPLRKHLYSGKHVLVVTHLTPQRMQAIERSLARENVSSVQFLSISQSHSMLDRIDLGVVQRSPDLALVAAGIGSASVIQQLQPLSIPCIDSGISLECLIDANRRVERPFLLDDEGISQDYPTKPRLKFLQYKEVRQ
jgi:hypothetical protein